MSLPDIRNPPSKYQSGLNDTLSPDQLPNVIRVQSGFSTTSETIFHSVGIRLFGSTIRFRRFERDSTSERAAWNGEDLASLEEGIAIPEVYDGSAVLEQASYVVNNYSVLIGGDHEPNATQPLDNSEIVPSEEEANSTSSKSEESNREEEISSPFEVVNLSPLETEICPIGPDGESTGGFSIFNLAYLPKNSLFQQLTGKRYAVHDLKELELDFRKLGYGGLLSKLMVMSEMKLFTDWSTKATVSLAGAQRILLKKWELLKHKTMVPMALTTDDYLRAGQYFLVINGMTLYLMVKKEKVSTSYNGGISFSGGIRGILTVSPTFSIGTTYTKEDLTLKDEVLSIVDAVEHISGSLTEFDTFEDGRGGENQPAEELRCTWERFYSFVHFWKVE